MTEKKLKKYLQEFLEHLEIEKDRSEKTIQNYSFYLNRFLYWLGDKKPEAITAEKVRQYRLWLNRLVDIHGDPLKKNTQNYHLIAIRSFLKYLNKNNINTLNPSEIDLMKTPDRVLNFLDGTDLDRLLEAPLLNKVVSLPAGEAGSKEQGVNKISNDDLIKYRDKAILELLFSTGLRVSELAKLKKENLNLKKDEFTVMGKGRKSRVVFLSEQAKYWLKKYLDARKDTNPHLFISHDKRTSNYGNIKTPKHKNIRTLRQAVSEPITPRSIQRLVQKYAKQAGITKQVTPHTLRHSHATDLIQKGTNIKDVQNILGHSSITSTQVYATTDDKELKNIYKKFRRKK
ncbi:tyrosine-type recombinase/integrase [Patescibacteria group bacterium]|nr:tyrosine-type recombinase/integrase [Patescibacteria group bacterium]